MSCDEIRQFLAEGEELSPAAREHLSSCPSCRAMCAVLEQPAAVPDSDRLNEIRSRLTSRLSPVRALPPNRVLTAVALASFASILLAATLYDGHQALHALTPFQMLVYFGSFLLLAIFFSVALVEQIVPGSKRRVNSGALLAGAWLLLIALIPLLFRRFELNNFVEDGLPCLKLGTAGAVLAGCLGFVLMRKGFLTSPLQASLLLGSFAGLAGVTALALICPYLNAPHILVWHLGPMVIGGLGGTAIGLVLTQWAPNKI
jgi:Negative regulator of sigma F